MVVDITWFCCSDAPDGSGDLLILMWSDVAFILVAPFIDVVRSASEAQLSRSDGDCKAANCGTDRRRSRPETAAATVSALILRYWTA